MNSQIVRATGLDDPIENMGLDEIVAIGCDFHIERMSERGFWFSVRAGEKELSVWISSNRKGFITATHEWRSAPNTGDKP